MLFNSEKDERYLYFLRFGYLRRYEGNGDILYVEIPQIPKNLVIYRKPSIRNKFTENIFKRYNLIPYLTNTTINFFIYIKADFLL